MGQDYRLASEARPRARGDNPVTLEIAVILSPPNQREWADQSKVRAAEGWQDQVGEQCTVQALEPRHRMSLGPWTIAERKHSHPKTKMKPSKLRLRGKATSKHRFSLRSRPGLPV
jgi:hypothetical protein